MTVNEEVLIADAHKNPNGTTITVVQFDELPKDWLGWVKEVVGGAELRDGNRSSPHIALAPALCPRPGCDTETHTMAVDEDGIAMNLPVNEMASNLHVPGDYAVLGNVVVILGEIRD